MDACCYLGHMLLDHQQQQYSNQQLCACISFLYCTYVTVYIYVRMQFFYDYTSLMYNKCATIELSHFQPPVSENIHRHSMSMVKWSY